ncbi:MAG: TonB-dependent receptor [Hyphomonas sp.]|uniref:TonB-dependent receptor n=1 Tax=Hyphomonas sp. TaxID=87 RepID=UPI0030034E78
MLKIACAVFRAGTGNDDFARIKRQERLDVGLTNEFETAQHVLVGPDFSTAIWKIINLGDHLIAHVGLLKIFLCRARVPAFTTSGGGAALESETGDTFTAGIIFTPTFSDLNIALDYYEIEINDQIAAIGAGQIVGGCYGTNTFPNDFCDLLVRNPAGDLSEFSIDSVSAPILNVDSQSQRGLDLEVRYTNEFDFGTLTVEGSVNWALERTSTSSDPTSFPA